MTRHIEGGQVGDRHAGAAAARRPEPGRLRARARFGGCAALLAVALASPPAAAATCTRELSEKEFAGVEANEVICGNVAVRLMPLQSEMFYRRWAGELIVRSLDDDAQAKVAIAAFDAAGDLIGAASLYRHKIERKARKFPFRMEGMFTSLADTKKILLSVSVPSKRAP